MATVQYTMNRDVGSGDGSVVEFTWAITTANPDGVGVEMPEHADITWIARGTWGSATLKVQGSADATNYITTGLANAAGGAEASATADKVFTTIERPRYVRPILTTVGTNAVITVTALVRRTNPLRN